MAKMGRPGMSDAHKRDVWDRWAKGQSISEIGRAVCRPPGSIFTLLRDRGWVRAAGADPAPAVPEPGRARRGLPRPCRR